MSICLLFLLLPHNATCLDILYAVGWCLSNCLLAISLCFIKMEQPIFMQPVLCDIMGL